MSTEAQKRASEKYRLSHKDYYNKKSKEYAKKVRQEKNIYKIRIDKAIEYIEKKLWNYFDERNVYLQVRDGLLTILQGENNE